MQPFGWPGFCLPLSFGALQRHLRASPWDCLSAVERAVHDRSPAPPPGFLSPSAVFASASSTALFRAATVPGRPTLENSPPRDRLPLSRPLATLRLSAAVQSAGPVTLSPTVSSDSRAHELRVPPGRPEAAPWFTTHASGTRSPGSPADYGLSFHRLLRGHPRARRLPDRPGSRATGVAPTAGFTRFAALIPLGVRSPPLGCPRRRRRSSNRGPFRDPPLQPRSPRPARRAPPARPKPYELFASCARRVV